MPEMGTSTQKLRTILETNIITKKKTHEKELEYLSHLPVHFRH